ncbi:hypothetical protein GPL15_20475 [Clostridium sp. MCC353]|uniref:hypothetical protein n=1 Tax=Clostridium sp. MCC353 TaxID=2592646 RepID=UPI001C02ECDF|nr:hypothetical protein [Clostridium sp. MCC353]MBT9778859.1 hypothetical protein [Clostridium sp. MCC353]
MELVRDKTKHDTYMNSTLQKMFKRGELRRDHPQQRKADQWDIQTRDGFVATVIKHEDIDSIKICEQLGKNGVTLWLIDGLQRLTTLEKYRNGVFKLGKSVEMPIVHYQVAKKGGKDELLTDDEGNLMYESVQYDLRGAGYEDLPEKLKEEFDNYPVDVVKHLDCTDEEIGYHIRRYNHQKSMNATQSSITYMDSVARYVKNLSGGHRFFKDCGNYTANEKKKGVIDRVISESVMAMFFIDHWQKQSKKMGEYLNDHAGREEFELLEENLDRLKEIIDEDLGQMFNSKNSFIWFTLFYKFTKLGIDDRRFAEFLREFMNRLHEMKLPQYDNLSFDSLDANKSTKDKSIIMKKLNLLECLMLNYLQREESAFSAFPDEGAAGLAGFVRDNVSMDITEYDIDQYMEVLEDLTLNVDNSSKLLDEKNRMSLIAMTAYSFQADIDLDDWIVDFFKRKKTYINDQKENYLDMKADLLNYIKRH